ncbi:hypothetical protein ACCAA_1650004 [Candidatus Accumulibacter aalborgensis]|uniref:Uncharacterized protein n=1 Tax=Candidatus Accumulibacter aalborgensis TaxID=1860102 RepID=A0A1A8XHG8_9PROT|nr:hypothetical protein ACCAA_1650004 [Candidatus Accumulibacter aalborgensis]
MARNAGMPAAKAHRYLVSFTQGVQQGVQGQF